MNAGNIANNAAGCLYLRHAAHYSMPGNCSMQGCCRDMSRIGPSCTGGQFPLQEDIETAECPPVAEESLPPLRFRRRRSVMPCAMQPRSKAIAELIQGDKAGTHAHDRIGLRWLRLAAILRPKDWECPGRQRGSGNSGALLFFPSNDQGRRPSCLSLGRMISKARFG